MQREEKTWTNTTFKLIIIIKMIIVEVEVSHAEAFNIKSVLDYA